MSAKPKRFAWILGLVLSSAMVVITQLNIHGMLPLTRLRVLHDADVDGGRAAACASAARSTRSRCGAAGSRATTRTRSAPAARAPSRSGACGPDLRPGLDGAFAAGQGASHAGPRRRARDRERCLGRGRQPPPGRARVLGRLPRAGPLGERLRVPGQPAGVGARDVAALASRPEPAHPRRRLPGRGHRRRDPAADVLGRGRLDAALRRALPPPAAVRLPGPDAGRRGRRLADHLRRPAAVLRAHRHRPRRLRPRRRSGAAARRRAAAAAAPHQRVRAQGGGGHERARLALVAGAERDRVARLPQPAALRPRTAPARPAARTAPRPAST